LVSSSADASGRVARNRASSPNSYEWLRVGVCISLFIFACFLGSFAIRASKSHGPLNDAQISQFLGDEEDVSGAIFGLDELKRRMDRGAPVSQWSPLVLSLSNSRFEEVRHAAASVMAKAVSDSHYDDPQFYAALLRLLDDPSPLVRTAAAPPLAMAGIPQARPGLLSALQPVQLLAPQAGRVDDTVKAGDAVRCGDAVVVVFNAGTTAKIAAPFDGQVTRISIATGDVVSAGIPIGEITPSPQQVLLALRGLQVIGLAEDVAAARQFEQNQPEEVAEQARATEHSILTRRSL
jgi:biotin carboxyl carrier protein